MNNLQTVKTVAVVMALTLAACGGAADDQSDAMEAGFALSLGGYRTQALLQVANTVDEQTLDVDVGLDARAAAGLIKARKAQGGFLTLAQVDAVPYVGQVALERMLGWAETAGLVGWCGDSIVQPNETCDGAVNCAPTCQPVAVSQKVHGIPEGSETAAVLLAVANNATLIELDLDVGLDARAAHGIVSARPFGSLAALDNAPYVAAATFKALVEHTYGGMPVCGDGHPLAGLEACDDGNLEGGDGCSSTCGVEAAPVAPPAGTVNGFVEGSEEAEAILAVANGASQSELDETIGLDARAAAAIVADRSEFGDFRSLARLDRLPYVTEAAFAKLFAQSSGW